MTWTFILAIARRCWVSAVVMLCIGCGAMAVNTTGGRVNDLLSPEAAWQAVAQQDMDAKTLKAIVRIRVSEDGRQQLSLKGAVMARKPQYLRFEDLPLIGLPDFFLTINDRKIKVFVPDRASFYTGDASLENLSSFFPVPLAPEAVVALLMGTYPQTVKNAFFNMQGKVEGGNYRLDLLHNDHIRHSFLIAPGDHHLVRYESFNASGVLQYRAIYDQFIQEKGFAVPAEITVTMGGRDAKEVVIKLSDVQIVQDGDLAPYDLLTPPDARIIPLNGR